MNSAGGGKSWAYINLVFGRVYQHDYNVFHGEVMTKYRRSYTEELLRRRTENGFSCNTWQAATSLSCECDALLKLAHTGD